MEGSIRQGSRRLLNKKKQVEEEILEVGKRTAIDLGILAFIPSLSAWLEK